MFDLYIQIAMVITTFFIKRGTGAQPHSSLLLGIFIPSILWLCLREFLQFLSSVGNLSEYFFSIFNIFDMVEIVVIIMTTVHIMEDNVLAGSREEVTLMIALFVVCVQLLFKLGNLIYDISIFITIVQAIFYQLRPFLTTTAIIILSFANAFYFLGPGPNDEDGICDEEEMRNFAEKEYTRGGWTCTRYDSIISTTNMFLGTDWLFLVIILIINRKYFLCFTHLLLVLFC